MTEWTEEERGFVETALAAADAGNAGHWPTVATYLAAEVRRLREGATPAIDREALEQLFEAHGVYETTYISTERMESSRRILAAAVLALIGGAR